jgi:hypothetical protein
MNYLKFNNTPIKILKWIIYQILNVLLIISGILIILRMFWNFLIFKK